MTINEIKFHELDGIGINNIIFLVAELFEGSVRTVITAFYLVSYWQRILCLKEKRLSNTIKGAL